MHLPRGSPSKRLQVYLARGIDGQGLVWSPIKFARQANETQRETYKSLWNPQTLATIRWHRNQELQRGVFHEYATDGADRGIRKVELVYFERAWMGKNVLTHLGWSLLGLSSNDLHVRGNIWAGGTVEQIQLNLEAA